MSPLREDPKLMCKMFFILRFPFVHQTVAMIKDSVISVEMEPQEGNTNIIEIHIKKETLI